MITATDLLEGPRGRRLCTELLRQVLDEGSAPAKRLHHVRFWAEYHLDRDRGAQLAVYGSTGAFRPEPAPGDDQVAAALAAAGDAVDPAAVEPVHVLRALADTATAARYWQEPDAEDLLLARPLVLPVVARLAERWAGAAAVEDVLGRSASPVQSATEFDDPLAPSPRRDLAPGDTARLLREWREALQREVDAVRPRDLRRAVDAPVGGEWWSTPPSGLLTTSAAMPDLGSLELWAVEDSMGWEGAVVAPVTAPRDPRVLVIDGPDDWAALCRRWSVDVSGTSRRHDWYRTTGRDGAWVTPDWAGVAEEYDAVRVTVRGWWRAAGSAIPVDGGSASVMAGWTPGSTVWLRDPVPTIDEGLAVAMRLDSDDLAWHTVG